MSNYLGAVAGLLFDIGSGRYAVPPRRDDDQALAAWQVDADQVRQASAAAQKQWAAERESDTTHTEIQGWWRDLGHGSTSGSRRTIAIALTTMHRWPEGCLTQLPLGIHAGAEAARWIEVILVARENRALAAAFEVEHST